MLLRIENSGATNIDTNDYAVLDDDKVDVRVRFPGRRVAGMVVTELSDDFLRACFGPGSGLSAHGNRPCGELQNPELCRPAARSG